MFEKSFPFILVHVLAIVVHTKQCQMLFLPSHIYAFKFFGDLQFFFLKKKQVLKAWCWKADGFWILCFVLWSFSFVLQMLLTIFCFNPYHFFFWFYAIHNTYLWQMSYLRVFLCWFKGFWNTKVPWVPSIAVFVFFFP